MPQTLRLLESWLPSLGVRGKSVLEVGSLDVNGSARPLFQRHGPAEYIGVDLAPGPGVDRVMDAANLAAELGEARFDFVVSTDAIEHTRDWRTFVVNLKRVLRPGGSLLLSTCSFGFPFHPFPFDFWRFEPSDLRAIFSDHRIDRLEHDEVNHIVVMLAQRSVGLAETDLSPLRLYSVLRGARCRDMTQVASLTFRVGHFLYCLVRPALSRETRACVRAWFTRRHDRMSSSGTYTD